jgi:tetratricopeptide (TPR) repeat protein
MTKRSGHGILVVLLLLLGVALSAPAGTPAIQSTSQPATQPDEVPSEEPVADTALHLVAPRGKDILISDPLAAETALRLIRTELAFRGQSVRYWPTDQTPTEDAYPRLIYRLHDITEARYYRVTRTGNQFRMDISFDGRTYLYFDEKQRDLPETLLVGPILMKGKLGESMGKFSDFTINGQPATPEAVQWRPESKITSVGEKDAFVLERGIERAKRGKDKDVFAGMPVTGDFVAGIRILEHKPIGDWPGMVGLACMDEQGRNGFTALGRYNKNNVFHVGHMADGNWHYQCKGTFIRSAWECVLQTAPGRETFLGAWMMETEDWDRYLAMIRRMVDGPLTAVRQQLDLPPAALPKAVPPSEQDQAVLAQAAKAVESLHPAKILQAGRALNTCIQETPALAEGWYAGAELAGAPALQNLCSPFYNQAAYLAGPLSNLLTAQQLQAPTDERHFRAAAMVAFLCGYPKAADETLANIPDEKRDGISRALHMLIHRDYRPHTAETILAESVTPLEQFAWITALDECDVEPLGAGIPMELAQRYRLAIFLPMHDSWDNSYLQNRYALCLQLARDAYGMLGLDSIPLEVRDPLTNRIGSAVQAEATPDWEQYRSNIAWKIFHTDSEILTAKQVFKPLLQAMLELYSQAKQSSNPQRIHGSNVGPAFCASSFWDLQKSHLLLYTKKQITLYSVDLLAETTANCLEKDSPYLAGLFRAYHLFQQRRYRDLQTHMDALWSSPAVNHSLLAEYSFASSFSLSRQDIRKKFASHFQYTGRGAWQWARMAISLFYYIGGHGNEAYCMMQVGLDVDPWNQDLPPAICNMDKTGHYFEEYCRQCPYSAKAWEKYGEYTRKYLDAKKNTLQTATMAYEKFLELAPWNESAYRGLFWCYKDQARWQDALNLIKQAESNLRHEDHALSKLLAEGALVLLEQNRVSDALEYAQRASKLSRPFIVQYALYKALNADGQVQKAIDVCRDLAYEQIGGVDDFIYLMIDNSLSDDVVLREIELLLRHWNDDREIVYDTYWAIQRRMLRKDLIERAMAGPLKGKIPEDKIVVCELSRELGHRNYQRALEIFDNAKSPGSFDTIRAYIAARMAGLTEKEKALHAKLPKLLNSRRRDYDSSAANVAKMILGKMSKEQYFQMTRNSADVSYYWLIVGMEAELAGDLDKAREMYHNGFQQDPDYFGSQICLCWYTQLTLQEQRKKRQPGRR